MEKTKGKMKKLVTLHTTARPKTNKILQYSSVERKIIWHTPCYREGERARRAILSISFFSVSLIRLALPITHILVSTGCGYVLYLASTVSTYI